MACVVARPSRDLECAARCDETFRVQGSAQVTVSRGGALQLAQQRGTPLDDGGFVGLGLFAPRGCGPEPIAVDQVCQGLAQTEQQAFVACSHTFLVYAIEHGKLLRSVSGPLRRRAKWVRLVDDDARVWRVTLIGPMQPATRQATYAEILALPQDVRAELLAGEILVLPAPRPRHSKPQRSLSAFIGKPFDDDDGFGGPGGWWIFIEVDVALGPDVVRPDLAGWKRVRLPEPDVRPMIVTPDWVCEILSESNEAHDRVTKRRLYAEHGIQHYWIVDPAARTLEAFVLEHGRWVDAGSFDEHATARIPPFEAVELAIGRIFLPRSQP